ncbi:uncharacterized protein LDX57_005370 [Aspergillus melleus]|uniref:uncharacterized protein n=1 Tax=Aspergillus melleus TaxID=138277 RepID=UPI001E8DD183|nr:uncharacterized protein LDX57_005370 [Aspergillus melleus]KAH8427659.1 hypothetical protein LDX57_005370 [Aspergillus melleus]
MRSTGAAPDFSPDTSEQEEEEHSPALEELMNQLYTQTKDEEIVTSALFSLLCGLTVHTKIGNRWTVHRKALKACFRHASFVARVDGYLEDRTPVEKVRAVVEVKPMFREKRILQICMQESAQMVAWILKDLDEFGCLNLPGRRLHVSQNRNEIYITFAEYDDEYMNYLKDRSSSDPDLHFLTMHQYGPWKTSIQAHMRDLGQLLLAICLRAHSDMQEEGADVQESMDTSETDVDGDMSVVSDKSEDIDMDDDEEDDNEDDDYDEDDEYNEDDEDSATSDTN